MNIKIIKFKTSVIDNIKRFLSFILKPLANLLVHIDNKKYEKLKRQCKEISDEDLMAKLAKYLIRSIVKSKASWKNQREFILFNKGVYRHGVDHDFEERITYVLQNIPYSYKDEVLKKWHLYSDKRSLLYNLDSEDKELIAYERKLHELLKEKLKKFGANLEYIDERIDLDDEKDYFYKKWLDKIGYEKTLVVKVD